MTDIEKSRRCTECDDGWVHYAKTITEGDPANGVRQVIKPALFITKDRKYKVANISGNGAGVCHSCAHRVESNNADTDDFVLNNNEAKIIVKNYETGEIIIDNVHVDYWMYFTTEPICDMDTAKVILKGGVCEIDLPLSKDEKIARYQKKVEESGMTEKEYMDAEYQATLANRQ